MAKQLKIDAYDVPVTYSPDVCIIGAGPAGMSAAIAAARQNLSVLLIERYGFCGGATVAGLSGTICGLYSSGEKPEQLVFGFADEFYRALKLRGGVGAPAAFGKTLLLPHDSLLWKETADRFLIDNKCTVRFHVEFLRAFRDEQGRINSLLLKGKEGQFAVQPKFVIDASGDAEVVNSICEPTLLGNNGVVQTPTMIFKMASVDMPAFLNFDPAAMDRMIKEADTAGHYRLPRHHVYLFPLPNAGEVLCNMTRITYPDGRIPLGICSKDLTFAEMEGRRQAREYARFLIDQIPAFKAAYLVDTGVQIGIRQTRSIIGKGTLMNADVLHGRKSAGAITRSAWPIESHGPNGVDIRYLLDDYYDIPFEVLIPQNAVNLLVAGRCISAEHDALASARVTAQCFGMGYAAGAACGLLIKENIPAYALDGKMVVDWMQFNTLKNGNEK